MYLAYDGIGPATSTSCVRKCSTMWSAGRSVSSMTKFVCESIAGTIRALAWLKNSCRSSAFLRALSAT